MSDIAINYIINPFTGFWNGVKKFIEISGYARAAAELSRLGYYKEAKKCMLQINNLRK